MTIWQTVARNALHLLGALALVVVALAVGHFLPTHQVVIVAIVVASVVFTLGLTDPALMCLICTPLFLLVSRVGGPDTSLTASDLALGLCVAPAFVAGARPLTPPMRSLLWLSALYQAAASLTVVANPYPANLVEWFHSWMLVSGALLVGWVLGRHGRAAMAAKLLLGTGVLLALFVIGSALVNYSRGDFGPIYTGAPLPMNKNFSGPVLSMLAVVAYARPPWLKLPESAAIACFWLYVAAIGASQSRQAVVGLAVGLLILVFRRGQHVRRSQLIVLAAVPAVAVLSVLVRDQLTSTNEFNSANQRLHWYQGALDVWVANPWFGAGLRWWYTDRYPKFQPPNAELEVLSSVGALGLICFLIWVGGTLRTVTRMNPLFGTVALAVLANRFAATQFDIFWVSPLSSVPFLIAGIALGAEANAEQRLLPNTEGPERAAADRRTVPAGA
ncbi:O-antigen ligase family protein [Flexivirga sp. ID2601S]|uniref:O-antigen ligase family protein n=1 Tax=Flexivirga aerilata TaxID=1656889 RepID=A0A849AL68_9MICO|nr:O-antigen ligase family protein [Flexivirga aerilata]NNG40081.1 O-antigen ligase family protein [Flexivirga aerilata]